MQKLNDIHFIMGQGGSGRIANGTDFISGMLFYNDNRPAGMTDNFPTGAVTQIYSLADAVALGITNDYADETRHQATFTITNKGADDDTITIKVQEWTGGSGRTLVTLGTYTKTSAETTTAEVATAIGVIIQNGTNTHGYEARVVGSVVHVKARVGMGEYFNTGSHYVTIIDGTIACDIDQADVVGVASRKAVYYYHIARYFAKKPDGMLYLGIFDVPDTYTFTEIQDMLTYSQGAIVQLGIWTEENLTINLCTAIQTQCDLARAEQKILSTVLFASNMVGVVTPADLGSSQYNLATLSAHNVSMVVDNDGNATGWDLLNATQLSITSMGALLGCVSESAISEDIGNPVDRFNCSDGIEFETLCFGDGTAYNTVSRSLLNQINNNRYIYLSKIPYTAGSYYSDNHCAVAYTSDYAYISDNRVIDRVIKDSFVALTPVLKSRLKLKPDGTLTAQTIAYLVAVEGNVIAPLIASDDLAGDANNFDASKWVTVSATQKPNVTGKLVIAVKLAPNAIAHSIEVPIGYGSIS